MQYVVGRGAWKGRWDMRYPLPSDMALETRPERQKMKTMKHATVYRCLILLVALLWAACGDDRSESGEVDTVQDVQEDDAASRDTSDTTSEDADQTLDAEVD